MNRRARCIQLFTVGCNYFAHYLRKLLFSIETFATLRMALYLHYTKCPGQRLGNSKSRNREEGQDLVEYALVAALIALAATASMKVLGTAISTEFGNITASL